VPPDKETHIPPEGRKQGRGDLSNVQWRLIEEPFPAPSRAGKWNEHSLTVHDILRVLRTGAPWRDLPKRYDKWQSVYERFNRYRKNGTCDYVLNALHIRNSKAEASGLYYAGSQQGYAIGDGTTFKTTEHGYVDDAFGRMTEYREDLNSASSSLTKYRYNGLGQRIGWQYNADADVAKTLTPAEQFSFVDDNRSQHEAH
jgi:transposase